MALISAVRTGELTIVSGSGTTIDTTIEAVVTTRCSISLFPKGGDGTNRFGRHAFKASLTSSTNLRLVRNSTTSAQTVTLRYVVIEWAEGVLISHQSGNFNASTDPHDVTLGTAVTPAYCVPVWTFMTNENNPGVVTCPLVSVVDANTLRFDFISSPASDDFDCNWILLEFDPTKILVQTGTVSFPGSDHTETAAISSVDLSQSIVLNGGSTRAVSSVASNSLVRFHLSSATEVTAQRYNPTGDNGASGRFYVMTFLEPLLGATGNATIADAASSVNPTFTEITADLVAPFSLHPLGNCYYEHTASTNLEREFLYNIALGSPVDDATLSRVGTAGQLHINYAILAQALSGGGGAIRRRKFLMGTTLMLPRVAANNPIIPVDLFDGDGVAVTGIAFDTAGLTISVKRELDAGATLYEADSSDIEDITTLGTYVAPSTDKIRFKLIGANDLGAAEIHLPQAAVNADDLSRWATVKVALGGVVIGVAKIPLVYDVIGSAPLATQSSLDGVGSDAAAAKLAAEAADGKLDVIDPLVDDIKAKTDNLPSDPADQSLVIAATDAIAGLIGTPAADLAADIAAVKAVVDAANVYKKNVAVTAFAFYMELTDGSPGTGLTVTGEVSKDGGAFAGLGGSITEISAGWYEVDIAQGEMNADEVALKFTAPGAKQRNIKIRTQA